MPVFNNILAGAAAGGAADYKIERSLRFNDEDSAYLNRTPSSAGNTKTWTFSCWVKRSEIGSIYPALLSAGANSQVTGFFQISVENDEFSVYMRHSSGTNYAYTNAKLRDTSAWYHLVVAMDTTAATEADRLKMYVNGVEQTFRNSSIPAPNKTFLVNGTAVHQIGATKNSTGTTNAFYAGYMADVHLVDGQALDETSFGEFDADTGVWNPIKFTGDHGTNGFHLDFSDNSSDAALGTDSSGKNNTWTVNNLVAQRDRTGTYGATISNSTLSYDPSVIFDGVITSSYQDRPTNNTTVTFTGIPTASTSLRIGVHYIESGTMTTNGSLTVVNATSAIYSAAWYEPQNITYPFTLTSLSVNGGSASHGFGIGAIEVDGVVLNSGSGADTDQLLDSPTNYEADSGNNGGNYATWNPLSLKKDSNSTASLSNGNLALDISTTGYASVVSTIATGTSGKYYCEISFTGSRPTATNMDYFGVVPVSSYNTFNSGNNEADLMRALHALSITASTTKVQQCKGTGSNNPNTDWVNTQGIQSGDVVGIGIDCDTGILTFYKNGSSLGTYPHRLQQNESYLVFATDWGNTGTQASSFILNAGQRPFKSTPPSGFKSLCTTNLADPLIADGSKYFDIVTATGDGQSSRSFPLDFSPDFIWAKSTNLNYLHDLFDIVRTRTKRLIASNDTQESNYTTALQSFDTNGFTWGNEIPITQSGTYGSSVDEKGVFWCWDGGPSNSSISAGSLTSSLYNSSQTWSTYGTHSGDQYTANAGTYVWADVFDNLSDNPQDVGYCVYGPNQKWTFTNPISVSSSVAIAVWGLGTLTLNAGESNAVTLTSGGEFYNTISTTALAGATLKNIQLDVGTAIYLFSVHIDGARLVDPNLAPSVPSSASVVRANPTAGFSIVSYEGTGSNASIAHGLNSVPEFAIFKARTGGNNHWLVYHKSIGNDRKVNLNLPDIQSSSSSTYFQSKDPTSSLFYLGSESSGNWNTQDMIGYLFSSVEGYSSIGKYVGNQSADGPFIHTGFRPAYILTKGIDDGEDWYIRDTTRSPYNPVDNPLRQDNGDEYSGRTIDILSNGFKIRDADTQINESSKSYLYVAFAENPFKYSRAR